LKGVSFPEEVKVLSEKTKVDPEKTKAMQERTKERNLVIKEIKSQGPLTVEELSKAIGMEKSKLLKHLIAMRQFGKVAITGERNNQFVYDLPKESK
jgi:DNA-binding transcriptional ArsR family regulator